jgi:hypothetical protein
MGTVLSVYARIETGRHKRRADRFPDERVIVHNENGSARFARVVQMT